MSLSLTKNWFSNTRADLLAGITVAFALIPEAIAFSIIAGVDPMVGLYASFWIAVIIAFAGGRPAMISAATGAMALVVVSLVKDHGVEYLFAATILTGIIQVILGFLKVGRLITFVPHSVMTGFVNALAILIFTAQLPHFEGQNWQMYVLVAITLLIIIFLPRLTKAIPSALAAIFVVYILTWLLGWDVMTVGSMGNIASELPVFHLPDIPLNFETLKIIFPYSLSLAVVGLLESLLTATIVDEMTDTKSDKNREVKGQGIANFVTGFFGGMAGCAMIGQSVINVSSGARTRLSTLVAGSFLLFLIIAASPIVKEIPMAALVGVMFMVSVGTFDWGSLKSIVRVPRADTLVMIVTVGIVVATHDLSKGVLAGVVLSAVIFAWKMARISLTAKTEGNGIKTYEVKGQMFFGTMSHFVNGFEVDKDPERIRIDFSHSHLWDQSAVVGVAKVKAKYEQAGKHVEVLGLNEESQMLVDKVGYTVSGH
ncbi:SulP family inorganic anion transporter [Marinicrinis lubricantis]|uniref:SulP family inorganic anion transporter n=1 Tax=Marinicrinis lubricantis TaxID=2086470 RepID=A0ABW1IRH3_9BACL